MKALTLTQPWATLVALGAKNVETRSWPTRYRGPIAIHAAKGFPGWCRELCRQEPFRTALSGMTHEQLPLGVVLCTTAIVDCLSTHDAALLSSLTKKEEAFGDYGPGRYGFLLDPARRRFDPPIFASGALGLWEWDGYTPSAAERIAAGQMGLF